MDYKAKKLRYGDTILSLGNWGLLCPSSKKSFSKHGYVLCCTSADPLSWNCRGSYLWLPSKTFLCVFPPLLWDLSQFIVAYHWINWQHSCFQFVSYAVTCLCSLASTQGEDLSHQLGCRGQEGQELLLQTCGEVSPPRIQCSRSPSANVGSLSSPNFNCFIFTFHLATLLTFLCWVVRKPSFCWALKLDT